MDLGHDTASGYANGVFFFKLFAIFHNLALDFCVELQIIACIHINNRICRPFADCASNWCATWECIKIDVYFFFILLGMGKLKDIRSARCVLTYKLHMRDNSHLSNDV